MTKDTLINPSLTPSGQVIVAESILGKIQEPQTRWSPGALAASMVNLATVPMVVVVSLNQALALQIPSGADARNFFNAAFGASIATYVFTPEAGDTKSRFVVVDDVNVQVIITLEGEPATDPLLLDILSPRRPSYTAASLINALETSLFDNHGGVYLILLDQNSGEVSVILFPSQAAVDAAIVAMSSTVGVSVFSAFLTTPGSSSSGPSSLVWE